MEDWEEFAALFDAAGLRSNLRQFLARTARPFMSGAPAAVVNYWQGMETDYGCKTGREEIERLPKFEYKALPHQDGRDFVRLLKILPREKDGRLRCKLRTYALDECPEYDALSYAWSSMRRQVSPWCATALSVQSLQRSPPCSLVSDCGSVGTCGLTPSASTRRMSWSDRVKFFS